MTGPVTGPVVGLPEALAVASRSRCLVLGVVNVTPDSFSDAGRCLDPEDAIRHGLRLVRDGADAVDVGGESTRPGAARPSEQDELARVVPVVRALAAEGVVVSIDTMRATVASAALAAGAAIVNDVSGGLADPAIATVVAQARVPFIAMHWRGPSATMNLLAHYDDVVREVAHELAGRLAALAAAGVDPGQVVLDPGLGFAKRAEHNWTLLGRLPELAALGRPLLVGASRKRFLGALLAAADGAPRPLAEREAATAATTVLAAQAGAWCVRVHDVRPSADAVRVVAAAAAGAAADGQPAGPGQPPWAAQAVSPADSGRSLR